MASIDTSYEFLMQIIKNRRSTRKYKSDTVEDGKIEKLIEAARWAPSASNTQPWRFVIITERKIINSLESIMTGAMGIVNEVPALICICVNKETKTYWTPFDVGCALQNILLCAHSLSLGSCTIGSFDVPFVTEILELPDSLEPVLFVILGYSEKEISPPSRMALNELVFKRFVK